jgi:hypothetical protein
LAFVEHERAADGNVADGVIAAELDAADAVCLAALEGGVEVGPTAGGGAGRERLGGGGIGELEAGGEVDDPDFSALRRSAMRLRQRSLPGNLASGPGLMPVSPPAPWTSTLRKA